jgi:hypothetical protein
MSNRHWQHSKKPFSIRHMKRIVALLVLVALAVAAANVLADPPEFHGPGKPVDGTVTIAPTSDPDPDGGPPWALRYWQTTNGWVCTQVGRVQDGKLGEVDELGNFTEVPARPGGCAGGGPARPFDTRQLGYGWQSMKTGGKEPRTVIYGGFGPALKRVEVADADWSNRRDLAVTPDGIYVAVFRGFYNELTQPRVRLYLDGGCGPDADKLVHQWYHAHIKDCFVVVPLDEPRPKPESAASRAARKHPSAPRPVRVHPRVAGPGRRIFVRFKTPITIEPGDGYQYKVAGPAACRKLLKSDSVISGYTSDFVRNHWGELILPLGGKSKHWCRGDYRVSVSFWSRGKTYAPFGSATFRIR